MKLPGILAFSMDPLDKFMYRKGVCQREIYRKKLFCCFLKIWFYKISLKPKKSFENIFALFVFEKRINFNEKFSSTLFLKERKQKELIDFFQDNLISGLSF